MGNAGPGSTSIESATVAVAAALSVTVTMKLKLPVLLGTPWIRPAALKTNPAGNEPETSDQE